MQGADNVTPPSSSAAVTKQLPRGTKPTKFIVIKSGTGGAGSNPQNHRSPVVTKVIRAPGPTSIAPGIGISVTQTLRTPTGNTNAASGAASSTSNSNMVSTRKAYERHGTEEFLKRFTVAGGSVKTVVKANEDMKVDACKPATTAKKTCKPSPTQINIFSALDEELSNLKKKEPPKKLVPKIELSRTYQPPSKTTTVQPQPVLKSQESKENEDESFFEKFNKSKDNWLLDFSGSPTKSPVKPGGSIAEVSDESSEDNFPVECKVQLARVIPKPEQLLKVENRTEDLSGVIVVSSSSDLDESRDEEKDPNFKEPEDADALMASESDSSETATKESKSSESGCRQKGEQPPTPNERELSFVEARSRRKRKPPTYFGYEDHELSYNHGLNLVITSQGQDETDSTKKKKPITDVSSSTSSASAVSKRKFRASSRKGGESDDEDSKSTSSEQSLSAKKASRSYSIASDDSSDEEVLNTVAKRERSQRGTTVEKDNSAAVKAIDDQYDLKTTAFRLYYKDVLDSVQSDETDTEKITKVITQMWFDLDKSQREKFEKQARQLSQISLPPSPQKGKPEVKVQGLYYGEKSTSKEKVKSKNKERKSSKSNGSSKETEGGILSKVAADLQSTTDDSSGSEDSSTSSEEGSPVVVAKKRKQVLNVRSSSPPRRKIILPDSTDDLSESELDSSDSSANEKRIVNKKSKEDVVSRTSNENSGLLKTKPAKSTKSPTQKPEVARKEPALPKICFNCPKEAIECSLWSSDGQYCSISCCVLHCKKLYNDWVCERKRRAELEREQSEIEALKHAKDFFCIETEEEDTECNGKSLEQDLGALDKPQVIEIEAD